MFVSSDLCISLMIKVLFKSIDVIGLVLIAIMYIFVCYET
jgi:hypothetical protein